MGGAPNQKGKMLGGHHARARPGASAHSPTTLCSALRYCNTPRPLAVWEQPAPESSPPAPVLPSASSHQPCRPSSPGLPRSRTRTESREGPALCASGNGIGRKAARVPPRAGRGGLSRLAGPAPAAFPGSGCVPGCRPPEHEPKIGLALCRPRYSSFRPDAAGDWPQSRDVGGSAHAPAQPLWSGEEARGSACFSPNSYGLASVFFLPGRSPLRVRASFA